MAIARGSTLAPFTAAIGHRYAGRYPKRFGSSRVVQGNVEAQAINRGASPYVINPYVNYMPVYTGRFAGRRYPYPDISRHRRLGQGLFSDIGSLFTPNPGGGSVTTAGTTQYVNSAGLDQSTVDPNAGAGLLPGQGTNWNPLAVLSEDASGTVASLPGASYLGLQNPQDPNPPTPLPTWGKWALGIGAGLVVLKVAHLL